MTAKKLIDIGANLSDLMFKGVYNGSNKHEPDLDLVLQRAKNAGVHHVIQIIATSGSLQECRDTLELIEKSSFHSSLSTTAGCHPTRCLEIFQQPDQGQDYLLNLKQLVQKHPDKIIAIGEFGLDYDRLHFCPKDAQLSSFEKQLTLVENTKLPMFLHCRNAATDLHSILQKHANKLYGGVIHSFDGTLDEANKFIELGYYIGLNGCSFRTEDNLDVVRRLPLNKLLLETDAPWCEIRSTHPSHKYVKTIFPSKKKEKFEKGQMVKGRNEPCNMIQVLEVLASLHNLPIETVEETVYQNTVKLFPSLA